MIAFFMEAVAYVRDSFFYFYGRVYKQFRSREMKESTKIYSE